LKKFLTDIISKYLGKVKYNKLPKDVIEKAKLCILDSIGCALGGSATNKGEIVISSLLAGERGFSTIFGREKKTSLASAVFINSTLSNILDFDDTYIGHPGATIVPVALNIGEYTNASGKEAITAVVLAYEVAIRIGLGLRPTVERKYVHGHGTWQVFGAVVTASKLLGLNTGEIANALGIAGASAPLPSVMKTVYGLTGPTMAKNNYGTASEVGVRSALLARSGFTGPKDIFDGETGFWRMISTNHTDLDKVLNKTLGIGYRILNNTFKPYPCCRLIHSSIDAILNVVNNNDINLSDIEKILIKTISPLCRPPFSSQTPKNMIEGQFNAPYVITCALLNINSLEWYERKNMLDESLSEVTKKIEFEVDSNADKLFREDPGAILATALVYLKNGKDYLKEVLIPKGDPRNPLITEDLIKKFKRLAFKVLDNEYQVMSLINMIMKLEKLENVNELTKILS
jgi:2-methylcitrate dehydratase PrpD